MKNSSEEIFSLLDELKSTLEQETQFIKKMDRRGLMELLPRKLFLVEQIGKITSKDIEAIKLSGKFSALKKTLSAIMALNDTNRILTEEALGLCTDFLNALLPKQYRHDGRTEAKPLSVRGATFRAEA